MDGKKLPDGVNPRILKVLESDHSDSRTLETIPRRSSSPDNSSAKARFGLAVILCGLFTTVGGLYLNPEDVYSRGFLLFTGIFVIIYGAWVFDKANKTRD